MNRWGYFLAGYLRGFGAVASWGMVEILAIDPGTKTGIAYRDIAVGVTAFTRDFSGLTGNYAALAVNYENFLARIITEHEPQDIVFERPFFSPKTPTAGKLLHGLAWEIEKMGFKHNIPVRSFAPISIKTHVTGNRFAKKHEVMQAIQDKGHKVRTSHEADAVALLLMVEDKHG